MFGRRLTSEERAVLRQWLEANERNLCGMEVCVRVAHAEFNRMVREERIGMDREISFSTFARAYLYLRTAGYLKDWPMSRGRGDDWNQALFSFALEGAA